MFSRIAIVNRGEAAVRLIRAVRELNGEGGDLRTIALHTAAEAGAMFVRQADEAVRISSEDLNPYLDLAELERALRESGADAAWPGWGFVSENPQFAELCASLGVTFIGPDADVMRTLGDKIGSKRLAERSGVPIAPWSGGAVESLDDARGHAATIGYPLVIKATAGGGGRGIRIVGSDAELDEGFERVRAEAQRAFGDATVFMEKLITDARHIEVQIAADSRGGVWAVGVRDCSVQRRRQKVIEESRSTALTPEQEAEVCAAAVTLARAAGYRTVGTVEFLHQPALGLTTFLEVNPRLQVEHPVTELTTGLDLVKLQLHLAAGGCLEGGPPPVNGHAIEARLNAEDADRGFAPAPGTVELLAFPTGPGIRVDTGIAEGDTIPPEYDSMVAKVMAWGRNRDEARARLQRALTETTVVMRGGTTNKAFLLDLLDRPEVRDGRVHTGWLDELSDTELASTCHADVGLLIAAIDAYDAEVDRERVAFFRSAVRGRPQARAEIGYVAELRNRGHGYRVRVTRYGPQRYRVDVDGSGVEVTVERLRRFESRVTVGGRGFRVVSLIDGADHLVEVDGVAHRFSPEEGGVVRAPAPAMVVAVTAKVGDVVGAGVSLASLESMKMELPVPAPFTGRVCEVFVSGNAHVATGAALLRLAGVADEAAAAPSFPRIEVAALVPDGREPDLRRTVLDRLDELSWLTMGYDVDPPDARRLVEEYQDLRGKIAPEDPVLLRAELGTLRVFADLCELSRNRRAGRAEDGEAARSPREYLHAFLRSLDVAAEGIPASYRDKLARALAHYDIETPDTETSDTETSDTEGFERTPALEEAAHRMFRAQEEAPSQLPAVLALLDHRLDAEALSDVLAEELRETLDRVITATQLRYPVVGDTARSLRFRSFDQPVIRRARREVFTAMRADLAALAEEPDSPERVERLVTCPQPLVRLLADRASDGHVPGPVLEILTRRFYRLGADRAVRTSRSGDHEVTSAEFELTGRTLRVSTALGPFSRLGSLADAVAVAMTGETSAPSVVDLYTWVRGAPDDPDALASQVTAALDGAGFPATTERVTVVVTGRDSVEPDSTEAPVHHLTFRRESGGFTEDRVVRDLHPMMAQRLHLWRLANFRLERLPSPPDTYLYSCVAHDNPDDERLIALAEVRDLTPTRDGAGRVTGLPRLEQIVGECLEALRRAQGGRRPEKRLYWNRVVLIVTARVEVPIEDLLAVARRVMPQTEGLGIERVIAQGMLPRPGEAARETVLHLSNQPGTGLAVRMTDPPTQPLRPLDEYTQKVLQCRRRGTVYPYELLGVLTRPRGGAREQGSFAEHDLDDAGRLVPVDRAYGGNRAGVVVGLLRTPTDRNPEGMVRVALFGDPTKALGSIAEEECRRILAGLDMAAELGVPVDWFALSAGAKIAMDSGSENMDWVSRVLRRIIEFTQAGGEVNVVVTGINVGAQPYWNAEATMLMHTRGILVMTPDSAMVLTGKQSLDFSGGVSAEDNAGIGGYERVMGRNGQGQYWVPDVTAACELLATHHEHGYVVPGERFPRRAPSSDPVTRDVCSSPHSVAGSDFTTVGDIFSSEANEGRKKPFDMRQLMRAIADADHPSPERWAQMTDAETAIVLDPYLGGYPVTMIGIESQPVPRYGFLPADGPHQWTAGTLFPLSSKKVARAINAASGKLPVVVVANLSGFDGSPESLRQLQLEYGAEIGRAIVNFDGPVVFCVVSRYHGGAFVVFSAALHDNLEVLAVEGSFASVIGGAPAAAVVFSGEVKSRTRKDPRVAELQSRLDEAHEGERAARRAELDEVRSAVHAEKMGELAAEFDKVHSIQRALEMGSVHRIVPAATLRADLVAAVERGMARTRS
ncbi:MAG: ATP-grasp domain-containing protein [Actinomycetota bacterium]|nr:ATP-grasp domain-containing protein [Actinomycetota bacterium]